MSGGPKPESVRLELGGRVLELESGRVARQADGALVVRSGDTWLLATAVAAPEPRPGVGFFPLTVEYRERLAGGGRIPGSRQRREGRITDEEVLVSRLADRSIRPLFPKGFVNETQVFLTVFSADEEIEPESFAILAAAAALGVSDIPWEGPLGGVRVALGPGGWQLFPTRAERRAAEVDLVVSSGPGGLVMLEGQAKEASEETIREGIAEAERACARIAAAIEELAGKMGRSKRAHEAPARDEALAEEVAEAADARLGEVLALRGKHERRDALAALRAELVERLVTERAGESEERAAALASAFDARVKELLRRRIVRGEGRPDGRGPADIRPITSEVSLLPRCHGSALFTRGETQSLVSCTLGTGREELPVETIEGTTSARFILHYNFPPYSVGEVRPARGPGRREIGHGNLAHRALEPVLPHLDDFPYTLRLVSDITESNGSSSMATVCGGCLALMDAGVPIARPVAGIAMGLIAAEGEVAVLSDILGDEDHLGDMDFKVAGSREGITAIQMDNKLGAIPEGVLERALEQAREGRLAILERMAEALEAPRERLSPRAPRVVSLRIRPSRIRDLIGPGGRHVQEIRAATGAQIDVDDDGLVRVYTADAAAASEASRRIEHLTLEPEVGKTYEGEVVLVRDFFAIVRLGASVEGRLHVSELDKRRVAKVGDLLDRGDRVEVRVMGVDERGRLVLSRRATL